MNVVATDTGTLVEIQGTGEGATFPRSTLDKMLDAALAACEQLFVVQREACGMRDSRAVMRQYGIPADVYSVTSYSELYRDGQKLRARRFGGTIEQCCRSSRTR